MKTALQIGLTALLVGALAFYGGVMFGRASGRAGLGANAQGFAGRNGNALRGQNGQGAGANVAGMRGGFANGDVISADAKSITVKSADGSTKSIYFDSNTRVVRSSEATLTDLAKGSTVVVVGTAGSDGSITARSVQLVPKGSNLALFGGGARGFGNQRTPNNDQGTQGQGTQGGQGGDAGFGGPPADGGMMPPPGQ